MEDPFDFQELLIRQPGKWLPNRASYEIFNAERELLATATETEAHTRLHLLMQSMPDSRVLTVTTADHEPVLTLIVQASEWITELQDPEGALVGRIRTGHTRRHYTLVDDADQTVGIVTGDLALKQFSVTADGQFARIRKTWAGITKEMLTSSDHYTVEFTAPVSPPARLLTVMMPIVIDLNLYGPV